MTKYLINKNFIYQNKKNNVLVFDSEKSLIFDLNETASIIFKKLKLGWEIRKIKEFLLSKFKVSNKLIENQITKTIKELLKNNILTKNASITTITSRTTYRR